MKALIVEDDFTNRKVLQKFLEPYAECDIAVDGNEAIEAFTKAAEQGTPYDLICLDIMMPEVDGHSVLKSVRGYEQSKGVAQEDSVKIVMTTALDDSMNVLGAFKHGCEAYVTKPIEKQKFYHELRKLRLID